MSKLIIWVSGRPQIDGHVKREFRWSETHRLFIYEGREFTDAEFNAKFERAWATNDDLRPRAKVVSTSTSSAAEPTVDEAVATLQKLAPELLKKKPGPKQMLEVVV